MALETSIADPFKNNSIKRRILLLIGSLVLVAVFVITLMASILTYQQMRQQTEAYFINQAQTVHDRINQRLNFLIENTALLTQNELMVNALIDASGRLRYLPPLVNNFMEGKDVVSLILMDYEGRPIFQTRDDVPRYNESSQLRLALAMTKVSYYIENNRFFVISPIEYYSTTQGAVVVEFDLSAISKRSLIPSEYSFTRLKKSHAILFSENFDQAELYRFLSHPVNDDHSILNQLGVAVEVGVAEDHFYQPIFYSILKVLLTGLLMMVLALYAGYWVAESIVEPILELLRRVKASSDNKEVLCSPLGTHDELEDLARAFDERTLNLQHQAEHDALTQLPNRVLFIDRLNQAIEISKRFDHKLAVLFLDLDRFKEVNDSFGHELGDELLVLVAKKIEQSLRKVDSVARFGGDEFVILINQIDQLNALTDMAENLVKIFREPFNVADLQFYVTCSIGIATFPTSGDGVTSLLKNADAAMYRAKQNGRNTFAFYDETMTQQAFERVALDRELRQAITENELEVYYQPQIDMQTNQLIGMEALIRWNHPDKGLIPPIGFIPFAEETGLIVEIDRWMMHRSFRQMRAWLDEGLTPGVLSINLSMMQLNHLDFIEFVREQLSQTQVPSKHIMFEVTETQVMRNPEQAIIALRQLHDLGVRIAIDDFGTGHSSLAYLKRLPVDKLKIDQSFVNGTPDDKDDVELVKAMINLSKSMNLAVLAEGVETQQQVELLLANGCYEAQGYYFAKPLTKQDIEQKLRV